MAKVEKQTIGGIEYTIPLTLESILQIVANARKAQGMPPLVDASSKPDSGAPITEIKSK